MKRASAIFNFSFFSVVKAGEDGLQGQEHAGSSASGPLHHRTARSLLHRAVDRWIRLPEPHQVSTQIGAGECLHFVRAACEHVHSRLLLRVLGSRSGSTRSERILRGRGSCWERGNLPPWPRHLQPAWSRTSERAGATARRVKRKITNDS